MAAKFLLRVLRPPGGTLGCCFAQTTVCCAAVGSNMVAWQAAQRGTAQGLLCWLMFQRRRAGLRAESAFRTSP